MQMATADCGFCDSTIGVEIFDCRLKLSIVELNRPTAQSASAPPTDDFNRQSIVNFIANRPLNPQSQSTIPISIADRRSQNPKSAVRSRNSHWLGSWHVVRVPLPIVLIWLRGR